MKSFCPSYILAAIDIKNNTSKGNEILQRRANGVEYTGNLYPEIFE